jgi:hypothetical protein
MMCTLRPAQVPAEQLVQVLVASDVQDNRLRNPSRCNLAVCAVAIIIENL